MSQKGKEMGNYEKRLVSSETLFAFCVFCFSPVKCVVFFFHKQIFLETNSQKTTQLNTAFLETTLSELTLNCWLFWKGKNKIEFLCGWEISSSPQSLEGQKIFLNFWGKKSFLLSFFLRIQRQYEFIDFCFCFLPLYELFKICGLSPSENNFNRIMPLFLGAYED